MRRVLLFLVLFVIVPAGLALLLLGPPGADDVGVAGDGPSPTLEGARDGLPAGGAGAEGQEGRAAFDGPVLIGRPRAERVGRGGVRGRVSRAQDDAPVAGARLTLEGKGFGDEDLLAVTTTDGAGAFAFDEVPAGEDYVLHVVAEAEPDRTRSAVAVRDGAITDLGTVWVGAPTTLVGVVLGPDGRPVPGAAVALHEGHFSYGRLMQDVTGFLARLASQPEPRATARAGTAGRFEIPDLEPGPVTLVASAPGYAHGYLDAVVAPAGEEARPWTLRLAPAAPVAGVVVDGAGRGLAGVRVAAMVEGRPHAMLYGRATAESGSDGRFRIEAAPASAESLQLFAAAPGHPLTTREARAGDEDVRIVLETPSPVLLRVLGAADERPLQDVSVVAMVQPADGKAMEIATGRTEADGAVLLHLHPGTLQVVFLEHPERSLGLWSQQQVAAGARGLVEGPEDAAIGAETGEIVFRVHDGILVEGTVRDASGAPVAGAEVSAFSGATYGRPVRSDAEGAYRIPAARGFGVMLLVRAPGFVPKNENFRQPEGDLARVEHDISLERAAVVTGRVVDEKGRPVAGAQVKLAPLQGGMVGAGMLEDLVRGDGAITSVTGRFVLHDVGPGEEHRLLVRHPAYLVTRSEPFAVEAGGAVRAPDLLLREGATLMVEVHDPDGGAVVGAAVELDHGKDALVWSEMEAYAGDGRAQTDAAGLARFERLPAGTTTVTASHPDWASGRREVTVPPDAAAPIRVALALRRGLALVGRVIDENDRPVADAAVTLRDDAGSWLHTTTDEDGRFRLERVFEGVRQIHVVSQGHERLTHAFDDPAAELTLRVKALSGDLARRRQEVLRRIQEVTQALRDAASDAERAAIQAELQQLSLEWQKLGAEASGGR